MGFQIRSKRIYWTGSFSWKKCFCSLALTEDIPIQWRLLLKGMEWLFANFIFPLTFLVSPHILFRRVLSPNPPTLPFFTRTYWDQNLRYGESEFNSLNICTYRISLYYYFISCLEVEPKIITKHAIRWTNRKEKLNFRWNYLISSTL